MKTPVNLYRPFRTNFQTAKGTLKSFCKAAPTPQNGSNNMEVSTEYGQVSAEKCKYLHLIITKSVSIFLAIVSRQLNSFSLLWANY